MPGTLGGVRASVSLIAILSASWFGAGAALAQTAPAATTAAPTQTAAADSNVEEVVVTGTRIRSADAKSASPITVITPAQILQTKAVTVEEVLRNTPAVDFSGGISSNDNNGGLGASEAGLRNLGPERTLVLVDGLRFPFTDLSGASSDAVDLNNIPVSMIDHVEILRDGASAIYGADAIGGVINFIMKKHAEGLEVDTSAGVTDKGDGVTYSVDGTLGINIDRGNILVNVGTDHRDAIPAADRTWATNEYPNADLNSFDNISSRVTAAVGNINGQKYYFPSGLTSGIPVENAYTLGILHNTLTPYATGGKLTTGDIAIPGAGVYFDYLPTEYLTGSLDRKTFNFNSHYDITPDVTAVLDTYYTSRQSQEELNPEPLGPNVFTPKFPNGLIIPALLPDGTPNPYNPTNLPNAQALYGATGIDVPTYTRRFENGPRVYSEDNDTYRMHAGLEGNFLTNYNWQVGYYYGRSDSTARVANEVNFEHLEQLAGDLPCGADASTGCSLANFFGYNTLTPAQSKYLVFDNTDTTQITESVAYGNVSGPIYDLPYGTLKGAVGFEYRTENGFDHPDSVVVDGNSTVSASPTEGGYNVGSGYAQLLIPALKDLPLVKKLDFNVSSRYDYFSTFGRALTWKAGVDYAVNDDFRLRASRSTGFRAPQVRELFGGAAQSAPGGSDPCAPGGAYTTSPQCLVANGGNPNSLTQVNQLSGIQGGNPKLKPETSQEWTAGAVFTPTFVPGLSVTVDYYDILVRDEINTYDPNALLALCYGGVNYIVSYATACTGPNAYVTRQGKNGTGDLGFVYLLDQNVGNEQTNGIEASVDYTSSTERFGLSDGGNIALDGNVNFLLSDNLVNTTLHSLKQQAGTYGFDSLGNDGEPRWKATLSATYSNNGFSFNWTTRYYGGVKDFNSEDNYFGDQSAGVFYHNISLGYKYSIVTATIGVDNLFDKDPPPLFTGGDTYITDAGYDNVGRFIYTKINVAL